MTGARTWTDGNKSGYNTKKNINIIVKCQERLWNDWEGGSDVVGMVSGEKVLYYSFLLTSRTVEEGIFFQSASKWLFFRKMHPLK